MITPKDSSLLDNTEVKDYFDEINAIMKPFLDKLMNDERYIKALHRSLLLGDPVSGIELSNIVKEIINDKD